MDQRIFLPRATLLLFCGISSSGKTTLISEVAVKVVDTFWIDKDTLNSSFMHDEYGKGISKEIAGSYYEKHVRNQSYMHMLAEALNNIRLKKNPILERNYNKQIRNRYFDDVVFPLFANENCVIKIIYCYATEDVILDRIIRRAKPRDEEKYISHESWDNFIKEEPIIPHELDKYEHIKIDTTQQARSNVEKIIEYLLV